MPDTGWAYMPQDEGEPPVLADRPLNPLDDSVTVRPVTTAARVRVAVLALVTLVVFVLLLIDVLKPEDSEHLILVHYATEVAQ